MALSPLIKVPLATVCCQSAGLDKAGQGRLLTQGPHTERQSPTPSVHPGRAGPGLEEAGPVPSTNQHQLGVFVEEEGETAWAERPGERGVRWRKCQPE